MLTNFQFIKKVETQSISTMIQNNNANAFLRPQQNQTQQPLYVQLPQNTVNNSQLNLQQIMNNNFYQQQNQLNQNSQQIQTTNTQNNLLSYLLNQYNLSSNLQTNSLATFLNNNQQNVFQLLGLIKPVQQNSLASFVINDNVDPNIPTLFDSLYPSQYNLYGKQSTQQPTVAQELAIVGTKAIINVATPDWAKSLYKNKPYQLNQQDQKDNQDDENNKKRKQEIQDIDYTNKVLNFKVNNVFKELSTKISGNNKLSEYIQFLDNFDYSNFVDENNKPVDNCQIIQSISPLDQENENLLQCVILHFYANLRTKQACFVYSCKNDKNQIFFYQICGDVYPLDLKAFNLDKKFSKRRNFQKSVTPNSFMTDTQFSTNRAINCKQSSDILKDISLIDILDEFRQF